MTASRSLSLARLSPVAWRASPARPERWPNVEPLRHQPRQVALARAEPFAERADAARCVSALDCASAPMRALRARAGARALAQAPSAPAAPAREQHEQQQRGGERGGERLAER